MKSKLYKIEDIVKDILTEDIHAREDDYYLMYKVLERLAPRELQKSYKDVLLGIKPISFKSVERARRKLQSKYDSLKASDKVQVQRIDYENQYIQYATEENHIPFLY